MSGAPVMISIPGYPPSDSGAQGIPTTNDDGGSIESQKTSYIIPPVVWMFVFLTVGYVGLRMILDE